MEKNPPHNNSALFYRISQGDEEAFREVFYYYNQRIYPYILSRVHSPAIAHDMVQDVYLKLWLHRDALAAGEGGEAYLYKIATNLLHDYYRRSLREDRLKAQTQGETETTEPTVQNEVWYSETRKLLDQAMQRLPARQKLIYSLRQEGYSYDEIAAQLQISLNTVKNQLVKATHSIRDFLKENGLSALAFIVLTKM